MFSFDLSFIKDTAKKKTLLHECNKVHASEKVLEAKKYNDAIVLSSRGWTYDGKLLGGVVDSDGKYIRNSGYAEYGGRGYNIDGEDIVEKNETVIFLGFFNPCWGHLITDSLSKLWYLQTPQCEKLIEGGAKIIYITQFNADLPEYNKELFSYAGIEIEKFVHIKQVTKYKQVIVPDNSLYDSDGSIYYTREFVNTIDQIKSGVQVDENSPKKIYYTRTAIKDVRERGRECDVERLFRKNGYAIISPEKHTVKQQIQFMMGCDKFAAAEGSVSHGTIFCKPRTEVAILRKVNYVNTYTPFIGQMSGLKTVYIDANHSTMAYRKIPTAGPFYVCVTSHLRRYLGENGIWIPFFFFFSYWKYFFSVPIIWLYKKIRTKMRL